MGLRYPSSCFLPVFILVLLSAPRIATGREATRYREPRVSVRRGVVTLVLPYEANEALRGMYPEYHLPVPADCRGNWAVQVGSESVPYATWGDYDGDGLIDVALILIGEHKWLLLMLQLGPGLEYIGREMSEGAIGPRGSQHEMPQALELRTLKKGEVVDIPVAPDAVRHEYQFEILAMKKQEGPTWLYAWDGHRFQRLIMPHQ